MNVTVRGYISQFRVRELQAVLEQLGLSRTGRKADLVARIFAFFGEEPPTNPRCIPMPMLLPPLQRHTHLQAACLPLSCLRPRSTEGLPRVARLQVVYTS
jgi:SAP domain